MVKPCYGACVGFVGGLFIGWIVITFALDPDLVTEFQGFGNTPLILIAGVIGLFVGLVITYVTQKEKEESIFS